MKASSELIDLVRTQQRRLTVDEYHRMIEAEIFHEDDHVELLHGILVARSPQSGPHARIIQRLNGRLVRGLGEGFDVRVQLPVTLRPDDSEPEPDFSIVRSGDEGQGEDHPSGALLIIEVSRTSVRYDLRVKAPLYAHAGVPEYWVIDVNGRQIHVMRDPDPETGTFRSAQVVGPEDTLTPVALPHLTLTGRELLA